MWGNVQVNTAGLGLGASGGQGVEPECSGLWWLVICGDVSVSVVWW